MTSVPGRVATDGGAAWGDAGNGVALACVAAVGGSAVDDAVVVVDGTGADEPEAVDGAAVDDVDAVTAATEVEPDVVAGATLACATSAADAFDRTGPSERAPGNSHHVAARAATPIMANTATIATAAPRRCGIATAGTEVAPTAPSACVAPVG